MTDIQKKLELEIAKQQLDKTYNSLKSLLSRVLQDSYNLKAIAVTDQQYPTVLKIESIAELARARSSLEDIKKFLESIDSSIVVEEKPADIESSNLELKVDKKAISTTAITDQMDSITNMLGSLQKHNSNNIKNEEKMVSSGGLPSITDVYPPAAPKTEFTPPVVENSLQVLESDQSPLIDIFAPGSWFHKGRGNLTIGSEGFTWYKEIDPSLRNAEKRARMPNGFYGGEDRPSGVLLRLSTCILLWDFNLDVTHMHVYIVGVSEREQGELPRWFRVSELSASLTHRLLKELRDKKKELEK